ncbi:MAG: hypothetical protein IJ498_07765 [Akkermansia sp.]|nr:hypothetical protein [Akkermansia sp.]
MRKVICLCFLLVSMSCVGGAQDEASSKTERVVSGLLDFGSAIMKQRAEKKQAQQQLPVDEAAAAPETQEANTMEKLGKSVGALVQGMTDPSYLAQQLGAVLKETTELTLRDYLNRYKDEGREYARELANIITEKIVNHEKVASVLDSVRMLCWGVVVYLTIISILIFAMLWRMKSINERVLRAIEELKNAK